TIRMRNTGSLSWSGGAVALESQNTPPGLWSYTTSPPQEKTCNPGETATFLLPITAPSEPGTYVSAWRLAASSSGVFGEVVTSSIQVVSCGKRVLAAGAQR